MKRVLILAGLAASAGKTLTEAAAPFNQLPPVVDSLPDVPSTDLDQTEITDATMRQLLQTGDPTLDAVKSGLEHNKDVLSSVSSIFGITGGAISLIMLALGLSGKLSDKNHKLIWLWQEQAALIGAARAGRCSGQEKAALKILKEIVDNGEVEKLLEMLDRTDIDGKKDKGYTALELMVKKHKEALALKVLNIIAPLLDPQARQSDAIEILKKLNSKDKDKEGTKSLGNTMLTLAAQEGLTDVILRMLEILKPLLTSNHEDYRKSAIELLTNANSGGYTLLTMAIKFGNVKAVEALMNLRFNDKGEVIPEVEKLLLDFMAKVTIDGKTSALMWCAGYCKPEDRKGIVRDAATPENRVAIFMILDNFLNSITETNRPQMEQAQEIIQLQNQQKETARDWAATDPEKKAAKKTVPQKAETKKSIPTEDNTAFFARVRAAKGQMVSGLDETSLKLEIAITEEKLAELGDLKLKLLQDLLKNLRKSIFQDISVSSESQREIIDARIKEIEIGLTDAASDKQDLQEMLDTIRSKSPSEMQEQTASKTDQKILELEIAIAEEKSKALGSLIGELSQEFEILDTMDTLPGIPVSAEIQKEIITKRRDKIATDLYSAVNKKQKLDTELANLRSKLPSSGNEAMKREEKDEPDENASLLPAELSVVVDESEAVDFLVPESPPVAKFAVSVHVSEAPAPELKREGSEEKTMLDPSSKLVSTLGLFASTDVSISVSDSPKARSRTVGFEVEDSIREESNSRSREDSEEEHLRQKSQEPGCVFM
jgi:hypothetical protein